MSEISEKEAIERAVSKAMGWMPTEDGPGYHETKDAVLAEIEAAAHARAEADAKPVAWRIRVGDSDHWSYSENESMADFGGKQSGLPYVKQALYAAHARAEAVGVRVKPLEWEAREERLLGATTEKYWRAQTAFDWGYRVKPYNKGFSFGNAVEYSTVEEAKAAAQADYERRILSALAHPAVPEGWRPIETAPKDGSEFQGWFDKYGWEPRCRFNPDSEALEIWGRTDYDQEGWDVYIHMSATHWMPLPKPPVAAAEKEARG